MKIQELLNEDRAPSGGAYYEPTFKDASEKSGLGRIRGSVKDWLAAVFKATPEDLEEALKNVKQSKEYRDLVAIPNLKSTTTAKELKNGTLSFVVPVVDYHNRYDSKVWKMVKSNANYKVLANGKIQGTDDRDHHRGDRKAPKPILVAGNPARSIEKTMRRSLAQLTKIVKTRLDTAEKNKIKASKAENR